LYNEKNTTLVLTTLEMETHRCSNGQNLLIDKLLLCWYCTDLHVNIESIALNI